ncbi:hypothetical protein NMG60_11023686 [Bertholletia excelsa]
MDTKISDAQANDDSIQTEQPPEALFLVVAYLPLFELLAMSQVCRSLRDAVNKDVLAWLNLIVEKPLNARLSDDLLLKFTSKSNGRLTTLALMNCENITDNGLQRVVEKNPHISKIFIPACTGLTPDGIIRAVQMLQKHNYNLVSLKMRGIYNVKKEHLKELQSILKTNMRCQGMMQQRQHRVYYHGCENLTKLGIEETNCPIDLDICPKCDLVRMVFDCPKKKCEEKRQKGVRECRGCYHCLPRCAGCGECLNEAEEPEEGACNWMDVFCLDCWLQLPKCNFCNKACCKQHAGECCSLPSSSGFICYACHEEYVLNSEFGAIL